MTNMTKKKVVAKKATNGHNKVKVPNGHAKPLSEAEQFDLAANVIESWLKPLPAKTQPSVREINAEIGVAVATLRDELVAKYSNYYGQDFRKQISWFMENYGIGILSNMEREKREQRQKKAEENPPAASSAGK